MAESKKKINLIQKLIKVRSQLKGLTTKRGHNHKYVPESILFPAIQPLLDEYNIMIIPSIKNSEVVEGGVKADMEIVILDGDSQEKQVVPFVLMNSTTQLHDTAQKLGSGLTYSFRYFLSKTFLVHADDSDPDSKKPTLKDAPKTPDSKDTSKKSPPKPASDGQQKFVSSIRNKFQWNEEELDSFLIVTFSSTKEQLTAKQAYDFITTYKDATEAPELPPKPGEGEQNELPF